MNYKNFGYAVVVAATAAVLVIGSAIPSQAKGKKKETAAPPQQQAFCFMVRKPVCAKRGDVTQTYSNACFAARDGAKVVSEGACKPSKAAKKSGKKKAATKKK